MCAICPKEYHRLQSQCKHLFRISTADRYSANLRAERGLQQTGYMNDFKHCFQACSVHKVHSAVKNSSHVLSSDISGLLNCGLATQEVGSTKTLRAILVNILTQNLIISSAPAPIGPEQTFRDEVFKVYLPIEGVSVNEARTNKKRRMIIAYYLNGNILEENITHHCLRGCCRNAAETHENIAHFLSWALIPRKLPVLSRKTWTGFGPSLSWVGLLQSHHNLFQRVMQVYFGGAATVEEEPGDSAEPHTHAAAGAGGHDAWMANFLEDANGISDGHAAPAQGAMQGDAQPAHEQAQLSSGQVDWQELRRQQRQGAKAWLATDPGPRLAVLTDSTGPLQTLLSKFLYISSQQWQKEQEMYAVQHGSRSYPVLEMAAQVDVGQAMCHLLKKFPTHLPAIPSELVDESLKIVRFQCLASGVAALHALLRQVHSGMPFQFFRLLLQGRVDDIHKWPACLRDSLCAALLEKFPTPDALRSPECQAICEGLMLCYDCDIADIECRHAQTRDHTKTRASAWVPSLETLAAKFALRSANYERYNPEPEPTKFRAPKEKKKTCGGGAWRAFVHQQCQGFRFTRDAIEQLAEEYKCLSAAERELLSSAGSLATLAHRAGMPSFGARQPRGPSAPVGQAAHALPGAVLDGAVVAEDNAIVSVLANEVRELTQFAGGTFQERYLAWKADLRRKEPAVEASERVRQEALVAKLAEDTESLPVVQQASREGPSLVGTTQFERFPFSSATSAVRWLPDISTFVQAGAHVASFSQCDAFTLFYSTLLY